MDIHLKISNGIALGRIISSFWIMSVNYMVMALPHFFGGGIASSIISDKSFINILEQPISTIDKLALYFAASGWSGTVVFAIISGFSLWYSNKDFYLPRYAVKRFQYVYIPYIIACVVAILVGRFASGITFTEYSVSGLIISAVRIVPTAMNWNSPLWYMTLMLMLYLFYPIVPMIYSKIKVWGIAIVFLVVGVAYAGIRIAFGNGYEIALLPIYPLMPFLCYFLLGIVLCHLIVRLQKKHWYYVVSIIVALSLIGSYLVYRFMSPPDFYLLGGVSSFAIMGIGMLFPEKWNKVLRWLGRGTIAVFLYHYIFVFMLVPYFPMISRYYVVSMIASYVVFLLVLSYYQSWLDKLVVNPIGELLEKKYDLS